MIAIRPTKDESFIYDCITHPANWNAVTDDGSVYPELYFPDVSDHNIWLEVVDDGESLGVFCAAPHGSACRVAHSALLPSAYGVGAEASRLAIEWLFDHTDCKRVIAFIPEYNLLARNMALDAGLTLFGRNEQSFLKNSVLYDELCFGISKTMKRSL